MRFIKKIYKELKNVKLVDRFLIVIIILLMLQSIYSMFDIRNNEFTSSIDVVVRTTIAAVFGYFMSVNFIKNESMDTQQEEEPIPLQKKRCNKFYNLQILVVGSVCLISIFVLLLVRNFVTMNASMVPTITQFRDIISSSIGFFLGMPGENSSDKDC